MCNYATLNTPNAVIIRHYPKTKVSPPGHPDWLPNSRLAALSTRYHRELIVICVGAASTGRANR